MLSTTPLNAANLHHVLVLDFAPICQIQHTIFSTELLYPPDWRSGEKAGKDTGDALPTKQGKASHLSWDCHHFCVALKKEIKELMPNSLSQKHETSCAGLYYRGFNETAVIATLCLPQLIAQLAQGLM